MTTPNALQVIADVRRTFGDKVLAGVGSILDVKSAEAALSAGAEYVITPVLRPDVIAYCNRVGKPVFAGCYTPTEAQTAHELGADFIKIFPADGLGPKYIQAIRGPLPHLKIVPTGGVDFNTAGDFIRAGCVAVAAAAPSSARTSSKTATGPSLPNSPGSSSPALPRPAPNSFRVARTTCCPGSRGDIPLEKEVARQHSSRDQLYGQHRSGSPKQDTLTPHYKVVIRDC